MAFSDITQLWEEGERKILNKLKFLDLRYSKLRTLDLSVTPRLEELNLEGCINFVELQLPVQCSNLKILNLSGSKVNNINLEMIPNLEKLNLTHCYCLQKIHAPVGCLKKLSHSRLDFSPNFVSFTFNKQYEPADLDNVPTLEIAAQLAKICLLHPTIKLPRFWFECKYDELGSSWSGNLEKLVSIGPCVCENLEYLSATICGLQNLRELKITGSIPRDLWQLESLEKLCLWFVMIQHLPDSICMMKHLKSLKVESCWPLKQLPKSICRLERLEELHIEDCRSLRDIPNSICKMKTLKYLTLNDCLQVVKLPEELGRLKCLKELNIVGARISRLPPSIFQLKGLRIIGSRELLKSYGFTSLTETQSVNNIGTQNMSIIITG